MRSKFVMMLLAGAALGACSKTEFESGADYKDQTLQGKLGGEAWTFGSGAAEIGDDGKLSCTLWSNVVADPCEVGAIFEGSDEKVLFSATNETGETPLDASHTVTLYDGTTNVIVLKGYYELQSISTTTIRGRLDVSDSADNTLNGTFSVTLCPST